MTERLGTLSDTWAAEIYQEFLDSGGQALLGGDVEIFTQRVSLPFLLRTATGETLLESEDEVRQDVQSVALWLQSQGATHYIRLVKQAYFLNPRTIEGWHVTHALRNAVSLVPTYKNRAVLRQEDDGIWRVMEAEHELANTHFPFDVVRAVPGAFEARWADRIPDIRAQHSDALPLYQAYLDALSDAEATRDVTAWYPFFLVPYDVHYDSVDYVVEKSEEAKDFFDLLIKKFDEHGILRLPRTATHAQFIAADQICGYHSAVIEKDGETIFGPIQSRMILKLDGNAWRCRSLTNSLSNKALPERAFHASDVLPTAREIQERMKK